jgi:hypothetical protein
VNKLIKLYLTNYYRDLTHQLESGGIEKVNFSSESTPYFDEESDAREYLVNLAITIEQLGDLK